MFLVSRIILLNRSSFSADGEEISCPFMRPQRLDSVQNVEVGRCSS
jgi:hypothetical protein